MTKHRIRSGSDLPRFYCSFRKHYVLPLEFENRPDNSGVCMACALTIHDMLRETMNIPEISEAARIKASREWRAVRETRKAKERVRQGSNDPGWVYYLAQGELIKIGYAKDVAKRMRAYGPAAELLAVHPGTLELEREMHTKFAAALARGREWFRRTDELLTHISVVRERFGDPSAFEYQYSRPKTQEDKVRAMFPTTRGAFDIADGAHYAG